LYLTGKDMSGAELVKCLGVSKALVSPALAELLEYRLIEPAGGDGKTRMYRASPDVKAVIRQVLATRERSLIAAAAAQAERLTLPAERPVPAARAAPTPRTAKKPATVDPERLSDLKAMISTADTTLNLILHLTD
jgi:hypothetical protein